MQARLIAVEGIDQSGKRTQTRLLAHRLRLNGFKVDTISFPIYTSPAGREIRKFLNRKRLYPPQAVHMLYSLNRWENLELIRKHLDRSDFLVTDRYSPSNLAYGVSKGLDLRWLRELDRGLPDPDLVLVLDVPVPASFTRKSKERDVHERNRSFMLKVNQTYKSLAKRLGWKVVDGTKPIEIVNADLWNQVQHRFRITSKKLR